MEPLDLACIGGGSKGAMLRLDAAAQWANRHHRVMADDPHDEHDAEWYELRTRYRCGPMAVHLVQRITAHGVVGWCDRYAVNPVTHFEGDGPGRFYPGTEGALPDDAAAKHDALEDAYAWLALTRGKSVGGVVGLWRGDRALLWDEGYFSLTLTPAEYVALREHWAAFGLPRDLCYRRGSERDPDALAALDSLDYGDSPEDLARKRRAFVRESGRYLAALSARESSLLMEWPGDTEEARAVEDLNATVSRAMLRVIRLVGDWRGSPADDAQ